jgi:hypothetical protein
MVLKRILGFPQRWNRYAYVLNNPLARVDPDGEEDINVVIIRDTTTKNSTTGRFLMRGGNGRQVEGDYLEPGIKGIDPAHPKGRIPTGIYHADFKATLNAGHPQSLFEMSGIPGFTSVYAHNGNYPRDTDACLLYGTTLGTDIVTGSASFRSQAMNFLSDVASDNGKDVNDLDFQVVVDPLANEIDPTPDPPLQDNSSQPQNAYSFEQSPAQRMINADNPYYNLLMGSQPPPPDGTPMANGHGR